MNKKGFATIGVLVATLFVTMLIIGIFFKPILNTTVNVKNSKDLTPTYINNMNGIERLYSVFNENVSHSGDIEFKDIGKKYKVSQLSEEYSVVRRELKSGGKFDVNNKTDLNIEFKVDSIESGKIHSYDIQVKLGDKIVAEDTGLTKNTLIEIDKNYIYNEATGETNYGTYEIIIVEDRAKISADIQYRKLDKREVEISNDKFKKNLQIESDAQNNVSFYFE